MWHLVCDSTQTRSNKRYTLGLRVCIFALITSMQIAYSMRHIVLYRL
jgi:hypothetical protein